MTTQESNVNVPNGFVSWEEIVGETIKLATSSLGIGAGLVGIVAAPVAVALIDKAVSAYKEQAARDAFKAEELAFRQSERDAEAARKKAEKDAAEQAFSEAEAAVKRGDVKKAAELLSKAAAGGSPEAMYALALSLLEGDHPDYHLAEKALRIASNAGIDDASLQLALLLYKNATTWDSKGKPWREHPNRSEYIKLVKKLAEANPQKNMQAVNLYSFELVADGKNDELEELVDRVLAPPNLSDVFALFMHGRRQPVEVLKLLYISTYTDQPEQEKMKTLKLCAKRGYLPAQNNLAMMYKESDPDECRRLLMDAARKGFDASLGNLVATDYKRFGSEGTINRYIALIEKKDELGARALARMCGMSGDIVRNRIDKYLEQGDELRMQIMKEDGEKITIGIDALGGATAAIVGECAREASSRKKLFAEFLTTRARELGYLKPLEEGTYTVYETIPKKKKEPSDPFAGVGRNDPCPCGSGKKFKKCHGMPKG